MGIYEEFISFSAMCTEKGTYFSSGILLKGYSFQQCTLKGVLISTMVLVINCGLLISFAIQQFQLSDNKPMRNRCVMSALTGAS